MERHERTTAMLRRDQSTRAPEPQDDLITMLVETEMEEDGERHLLTDDEIYGFRALILMGLGHDWRQLGILLVALSRPRRCSHVAGPRVRRRRRSVDADDGLDGCVTAACGWDASVPLDPAVVIDGSSWRRRSRALGSRAPPSVRVDGAAVLLDRSPPARARS